MDVLHYLVNELDQDPIAKDKDGLNTLHAATQNEMTDTVKVTTHAALHTQKQLFSLPRVFYFQWLVDKLGPKYILEKTIDGATPLHMAAGMILTLDP